jgi:hypothetical protein
MYLNAFYSNTSTQANASSSRHVKTLRTAYIAYWKEDFFCCYRYR